jgi:predicted double-glycine peptidase
MLSIKPIRQKKNYWCGPACLKMVLEYFGIKASTSNIASETHFTPALGVEASSIVNFAKKLGLEAFYKDFSSIDEIKKYVNINKIPAIVDYFDANDGHYSVVVEVKDKHVYLADPYTGYIKSLKINRFLRVWFDFEGEYIENAKNIFLRRIIVVYPPILKPKINVDK